MRHSGEIQFAVLPVFSILSSVTGVSLTLSRGSACSACVSSRLGTSNASGAFRSPCESDLVVEALVNPQLFVPSIFSVVFYTASSFGRGVGSYVQVHFFT